MTENELNFGEAVMKTGITRWVNGLQERVSLRLCVSARDRLHSDPEMVVSGFALRCS